MKIYTGKMTPEGGQVTVTDGDPATIRPLDPRFDLRNHSPTGFSWSYSGSGPAQLALALLADALGDEKAQNLYQDFKFKVVARLPEEGWTLTQDEIKQTVAQLEAERDNRR